MKYADCEECGGRIVHPDFPPETPWVHTTSAAFTGSPVHRAIPTAAGEPDLGDCPYYRSWVEGGGDGKCNRGCYDEPSCITDEPTEGWPSSRVTDDPWTPHGEAQATLRADGERSPR